MPNYNIPPGPGRPKGSKNKVPSQLKQMILTALDKAGGVEYLTRQAQENPGPFLSLVGKVLPTTLSSDPDAPPRLVITWKSSES
jgi:hypothetical protein